MLIPLDQSALEQMKQHVYSPCLILELHKGWEGDKLKITFRIPYSHYKNRIMLYGLVSAPPVIHKYVTDVLRHVIAYWSNSDILLLFPLGPWKQF